ncbi:MAG: ABC-F family ATP-binding cassette domain-containing protein, partial [Lachnospiraceae bacterium]|nr:ABC-F family ATP-binding cassette domain-containing protein [Lachnospiraceae bacterium]
MILSCSNIHKAFLDKVIIDNASFFIEDREKAAIVGINGAGKSTLLKILIGAMNADDGQVILSKGKTMGYLAQHQDINDVHSIYDALMDVKKDVLALEEKIRRLEQQMPQATGDELEAMMDAYAKATHQFEEAGGYALRSEVTGVLKGLGFTEEDFTKSVSSLSGGQKTRVSLGKLLLSKPDIILLDEPTNHLDMNSIAWLETFLLNYPGAVIIVAHDRYFLDKVVTKVIDIDNTHVSVYSGNYSAYAEKKAMLREAQLKA